MVSFSEIIKQISSDKRLVPDLMKSEKGNNFRAISESNILDVINPVLEANRIFYTVEINDSKLEIREAYGAKGKKLQFIATVHLTLKFFQGYDIPKLVKTPSPFSDTADSQSLKFSEYITCTEAIGMGIDDNDKAMGKAYTYAIKYALLKLFRLRYGDDSDFEASKPLYLNGEQSTKGEANDKKAENKEKKAEKAPKDKAMTENQRDYILGMLKSKKISETRITKKFEVTPSKDEYIPMKLARQIIKFLEEFDPDNDDDDDDLPF